MILHLPTRTPSLNTWQRMHWAQRAKLKKRLVGIITAQLMQQGQWPPPRFHALTITRYSPSLADHDNVVGGCKPLVDALVKCGLLTDDNPRACSITYAQSKEQRDGVRVEFVS